jgi:hypothetical protein
MSFVPKVSERPALLPISIPFILALLGSLTVRETIAFALRLEVVESPMNPRDINEIVNTTIGALGLTIGTSLVAYPKVSGLQHPGPY